MKTLKTPSMRRMTWGEVEHWKHVLKTRKRKADRRKHLKAWLPEIWGGPKPCCLCEGQCETGYLLTGIADSFGAGRQKEVVQVYDCDPCFFVMVCEDCLKTEGVWERVCEQAEALGVSVLVPVYDED